MFVKLEQIDHLLNMECEDCGRFFVTNESLFDHKREAHCHKDTGLYLETSDNFSKRKYILRGEEELKVIVSVIFQLQVSINMQLLEKYILHSLNKFRNDPKKFIWNDL